MWGRGLMLHCAYKSWITSGNQFSPSTRPFSLPCGDHPTVRLSTKTHWAILPSSNDCLDCNTKMRGHREFQHFRQDLAHGTQTTWLSHKRVCVSLVTRWNRRAGASPSSWSLESYHLRLGWKTILGASTQVCLCLMKESVLFLLPAVGRLQTQKKTTDFLII